MLAAQGAARWEGSIRCVHTGKTHGQFAGTEQLGAVSMEAGLVSVQVMVAFVMEVLPGAGAHRKTTHIHI